MGWKEALEGYFAEFMAFFFPQAHAEIDMTAGMSSTSSGSSTG